jgi:hypothetical protein
MVRKMKAPGHFIPLSRARRMVGDFLAISQPVPLAHGERRIEIPALREAVAAARPRPNWLPIFFKAYAMVASARPSLRRMYVRYPWPRLYEHGENVGSVVVSRKLDDDDALLYLPISAPEKRPLTEIDAILKAARYEPFDKVPAFRRQLRFAGMPRPVRRSLYGLAMNWMPRQRVRFLGTFGMSVLASMGIANLTTWFPWTTMIHYTPFSSDGSMFLRIGLDHRVLDGLEIAYALTEMEQALNGPILDEVLLMPKAKRAA